VLPSLKKICKQKTLTEPGHDSW